MTFNDVNLCEPISKALESIGYKQPTPIQKQAIPAILEGKDIFGCAQTGTGKTGAFSIPILQLLSAKNAKPGVKALILAPTRELAIQISESFNAYSKHLNLKNTTIFGGVPQKIQERALRGGVDILIATPGRLLDLLNQKIVHLNDISFFVLDEADRMLDMGFLNDIKKIIAKLPRQRQNLFFSATASPAIMKLANTLLTNPVHVSVTPVSSANPSVTQSIYRVAKADKKALLQHIMKDPAVAHVLVFTRTKRGADRVSKELNRIGISSDSIHGDKSQVARERALKGFKSHKIRVLVATDIASRGIDLDNLSHVINYEIPEQAETYVHRIGRTGRAGRSGIAFSFCDRDEQVYLKEINKLTKQNIPFVPNHPYLN